MKKAAEVEVTTKRNKKSAESPEWSVLKSGAMKHRDGKWYASPYSTGWFFYTGAFDGNLGPYKSFEDGLKEWHKKV